MLLVLICMCLLSYCDKSFPRLILREVSRCPELVYLRYFLAFLFCAAGVVFGQGTDLGTIRGTVTDSTEPSFRVQRNGHRRLTKTARKQERILR